MERSSHTCTRKTAAIGGKREETGLTRLQNHSSLLKVFSCVINGFQRFNNEGPTSPMASGSLARRRSCLRASSQERQRTSHKRSQSLLFYAGGGLGYPARDRALPATTGSPALPAGREGTGKPRPGRQQRAGTTGRFGIMGRKENERSGDKYRATAAL